MKKWIKRAVFVILVLLTVGLVRDRFLLDNRLIRLHVVGASNSEADQRVKLQVRDAVITALQSPMAELDNAEEAREYIQSVLPVITDVANRALREAGVPESASVTLTKEAFPIREYDTFTLPSGVYESLRITIGTGEGRNWWCVVFPSLCVPAASNGVQAEAVSSGFSQSLSGAVTGEPGYQVRFFFLDCLGRLENFFHSL